MSLQWCLYIQTMECTVDRPRSSISPWTFYCTKNLCPHRYLVLNSFYASATPFYFRIVKRFSHDKFLYKLCTYSWLLYMAFRIFSKIIRTRPIWWISFFPFNLKDILREDSDKRLLFRKKIKSYIYRGKVILRVAYLIIHNCLSNNIKTRI